MHEKESTAVLSVKTLVVLRNYGICCTMDSSQTARTGVHHSEHISHIIVFAVVRPGQLRLTNPAECKSTFYADFQTTYYFIPLNIRGSSGPLCT